MLTEHPFSGTGRVHQDPVEKQREFPHQTVGILAGHQGVPDPHQFDVFQQGLRAGRAEVIGHQQSLPLQVRPDLGRLPAGGRTEIQDPFSGLCSEKRRAAHGRRLLHIVKPRKIPGIPGVSAVRRQIIPVGGPWDPLCKPEPCRHRLRRRLQRIDAQSGKGHVYDGTEILRIILFQQVLHLFQEFCGKSVCQQNVLLIFSAGYTKKSLLSSKLFLNYALITFNDTGGQTGISGPLSCPPEMLF